MSDCLYSVKKLVERLNLQPRFEMRGISGNTVSYSPNDGSSFDTCSFSDVNMSEVVYRHRKQSTRNACLEINHTQTRSDLRNKPDGVKRRQSMSLYQLIKANQEKALSKTSTEHELRAFDVKSKNAKSHVKGEHNMFEFNNLPIDQRDRTVSETVSSLICRPTQRITQLPLISKTPILVEPQSPGIEQYSPENVNTTLGTSGCIDTRRESTLHSQSEFEPAFAENTSIRRRKSSGTCHPRLSVSKSVPLYPAVVTDETVSRRFDDFQLKVDTLRADLVRSMFYFHD